MVFYENIKFFNSHIIRVKKKDKPGYGLLKMDGNVITENKYDAINQYTGPGKLFEYYNILIFKSDGNFGLLSLEGIELTLAKYKSIECFSENLLKYQLDNKWGLINLEGNEINEAQYLEIKSHGGSPFAIAKKENGKKVLIDKIGQELKIEYEVLEIKQFEKTSPPYFICKNNTIDSNLTILNFRAEKILTLEADIVLSIIDDLVLYQIGTDFGIVKMDGTILNKFSFECSELKLVSKSYLQFAEPVKKYIPSNGAADLSGNILIPPIYFYIRFDSVSDLFIVSNADNKHGVVDANNKIIIPLKYERIDSFETVTGKVYFKLNPTNRIKFIAKSNGEIINPNGNEYIDIHPYFFRFTNAQLTKLYSISKDQFYPENFQGNTQKGFYNRVDDSESSGKNYGSYLTLIKVNSTYHIIDVEHDRTIETKLQSISTSESTIDGINGFEVDGKWGFFKFKNFEILEVIPAKYDKIIADFGITKRYKLFDYDARFCARVSIGGQSFYVSNTGKEFRNI